MSSAAKALIKKQLLQTLNGFSKKNRKTGKKLSIAGVIGIYILIMVSLGSMFFTYSMIVCEGLHTAGLDWMYFALFGIFGGLASVIGSAFMTYSALYNAKDNELLLSMPLSPSLILFSRMIGCYFMAFTFCLPVLLPNLIVYIIKGYATVPIILFSLINLFFLPLISLAISCVLGWLIALIAPHVKSKTIVTLVVSLAFIAGYYAFVVRIPYLLEDFVANAEGFSEKIKYIALPFYIMGKGSAGDVPSFLLYALFAVVIFCIVYYILSRSFIKLTTASAPTVKVKYEGGSVKSGSLKGALLKREFMRFVSSAAYMLNTSMGSFFMLAGGVAILIKSSDIKEYLKTFAGDFFSDPAITILLAAALTGIMVSYNLITAASISLEGKSIWLIQSLPVNPVNALNAKLILHNIITGIPAVIFYICTVLAFVADIRVIFGIPFVVFWTLLNANFGLILNIKNPNLNYVDEVAAMKNNWTILIQMFGGSAVIIGLGFLYIPISKFLSPELYITAVSILVLAVSLLLLKWLYTRGAKIFAYLD
jgi:ABC-2 type transport system permease protein